MTRPTRDGGPARARSSAWLLLCVLVAACDNGEQSLGDDTGGAPLTDGGLDAGDAPDAGGVTPDAGPTEDGGATCSRRNHPPCPHAQFCRYEPRDECGAGDRTGTCAAVPTSCDDVLDPVCGCDDETYPNACEAHRRGVAVHYGGACRRSTGDLPCGGRADESCPSGLYCEHAGGDCDGTGVCRPEPNACPRGFDPVCACDGRVYPNGCFARGAGVDVAYDGPCDTSGARTCGGIAGESCEAGEFCDYALGDGCDVSDGQGLCRARESGPCPSTYAPVCGCDGVSYRNFCEAAMNAAPVRYLGEC